MAPRTSLLIFATILLFASVLSVQAKGPTFKCLGEDVDAATEAETSAREKCTEELKDKIDSAKDKEEVDRCFKTCKFRKLGVLSNDDKFNDEVFNDGVDKLFPEAARAGLKSDMKKCFDSITEKLTDDDNCKNHAPYQECFVDAIVKNCSD